MYPSKNSVTKKERIRCWGTSKSSSAPAALESLPSLALLHRLRSDSGRLSQTPWNLVLPFSFQSHLLDDSSSPGWGRWLTLQCPPTPEMEMEPGNLILPSFSTRLNKYFWKIMTQGMAVSLRSQITHWYDARFFFFLSWALEIDF